MIDSGAINVTKFPFTFNVTLDEDNLFEGDETFTLNLQSDHNSIQLAQLSSINFTIIDSVSSDIDNFTTNVCHTLTFVIHILLYRLDLRMMQLMPL